MGGGGGEGGDKSCPPTSRSVAVCGCNTSATFEWFHQVLRLVTLPVCEHDDPSRTELQGTEVESVLGCANTRVEPTVESEWCLLGLRVGLAGLTGV